MGDDTGITGGAVRSHRPDDLSRFPGPEPIGRGVDYSRFSQYPDTGPELPPRRPADFLLEWAETFAATLIVAGAFGLMGLVSGVVASVGLLLQGADLLGVLQGVAVTTLAGTLFGAPFGLLIDLRRGLGRYTRGD